MTDIDDEAERLVDAALNGDARAIKQVAEALDDASDEESTGEEDEFVKPVTQPGYGITLHLREGESHEQAASRAALDPATQSAAVACNVLYRGNVFRDEVNINSLADELRRQVKAVNEGNLDRGEAMLAAQAHTLDALYNLTIRRLSSKSMLPTWRCSSRSLSERSPSAERHGKRYHASRPPR
jgi:hypothetical protein